MFLMLTLGMGCLISPDAWEAALDLDGDGCANLEDTAPNDASVGGHIAYYMDRDGDGFGAPGSGWTTCTPGEGRVVNGDDCDDNDPHLTSAAEEGAPDTAIDGCAYVRDDDGDNRAGEYDCDDTSPFVYVGADEVCANGVDDDCDGSVDERSVWYVDHDGDGYGTSNLAQVSCERPDRTVDNSMDCDDTSFAVYPGAPERCDGKANDCLQQADWSAAREAGLVTFFRTDGLIEDLSHTFSQDPAELTRYDVVQSGRLYFCGDPNTPVTWYLTLLIRGVALDLEGKSRLGSAVLSAAGGDRLVDVHASAVHIDGLQLEDGWQMGDGGAVRLDRASRLYLSNSVLSDNYTMGRGGAIYAQDSTLFLEGVILQDNGAQDAGGAIYLDSAIPAQLSGALLSGNTAHTGPGVYLGSPATLTGTDCMVLDETYLSTSQEAVNLTGRFSFTCTDTDCDWP